MEPMTQWPGERDLETGFEALYHAFSPQLYSYCYKRLHDHHAAADVAQETLARCWARRDELESQFLPRWLFRVARNLCIDQLWRRNRGHAVVRQPLDHATGGTAGAVTAEPWRALFCALAKLDERDRELFRRHYLLGVDYQELAAERSGTVGSVRVAVFRAKRLVLDNLAAMGFVVSVDDQR
jgi:RNA polymerase sigma-70 factor, ECF subfamily